MVEPVTSLANARLKLVRKLSARKGRLREGAFVAEGEDVVEAGLRAGWSCRFLLVRDELPFPAPAGVDVVPVEIPMQEISHLAWPPSVIGVFDLPSQEARAERLRVARDAAPSAPLVYLDGLDDPGNVGTVLRSSAAFGAAGVLLGPDTADAFSPKAVRAAMGATFAVASASAEVLAAVERNVVVLDAEGHVDLWDHTIQPGSVLCIGNERSGVSDAIRERADVIVRIPQTAAVESINAAQSATLALYECLRQQRRGEA